MAKSLKFGQKLYAVQVTFLKEKKIEMVLKGRKLMFVKQTGFYF